MNFQKKEFFWIGENLFHTKLNVEVTDTNRLRETQGKRTPEIGEDTQHEDQLETTVAKNRKNWLQQKLEKDQEEKLTRFFRKGNEPLAIESVQAEAPPQVEVGGGVEVEVDPHWTVKNKKNNATKV